MWVCVLVRVHDLDRLADCVDTQGGHSFGEDSCGSGFVSVLSPGTNTKGSSEQWKGSRTLGHSSVIVRRPSDMKSIRNSPLSLGRGLVVAAQKLHPSLGDDAQVHVAA